MNPLRMYASVALLAAIVFGGACAPSMSPHVSSGRSGRQAASPTQPYVPVDSADVLRRFSSILQFPTISHDDRSRIDSSAFQRLHAYLEEAYPLVHTVLERETISGLSLLYTWHGADPHLSGVLLAAHQDVVPVDSADEARWSYPPFSGAIADGSVWGRGTIDNKQGVAGILEAVEQLIADGYVPERTVYLAFGHDEEVGGTDGAAQIASRLQERGVVLAMVLDEGGAIFRRRLGLKRPAAIVGIAEKGSVTLELSVELSGGHSSAPQRETAVTVLTRALDRLENRPFPARLRGVTTLSLRYLAPALSLPKRILLGNTWLFRPLVVGALARSPETSAMIRTTSAVTMIHGGIKSNVVPSSATATVNFRTLPGETIQDVTRHAHRAIGDRRVQIRTTGTPRESHAVSRIEGRPFELLEAMIGQIMPGENPVVIPYLVPGGTDARYYTPLSNAVFRFIGMHVTPAIARGFHGIDEHLPVREYFRSIDLYYRLLQAIRADDVRDHPAHLIATCDTLLERTCAGARAASPVTSVSTAP